MRAKTFIALALVFTLVINACQKDYFFVNPSDADTIISVPTGFPQPEFPDDNAYTPMRWALGKKLFYDSRLSIDSSISCASCHKPHLAFSDDVSSTSGVFDRPGTRNAPTLTNVVYQPYFTREGGLSSLEMQVLVPIQEHNEFGFNIIEITKRLKSDSVYQRMSNKAYQSPLDYSALVRAIATFERSLISGNSAYDKFQYQNDQSSLTGFEVAGMELFYSDKTNCSQCHGGFNFTNYAFENNGLYAEYTDTGRERLTKNEADNGRFKVPTLRNIEVTGPYMHDGSLTSLDKVVEHYNQGGFGHPNKSSLIKPLGLSVIEKQQLVAFLNTLTDHDFINNKTFRN